MTIKISIQEVRLKCSKIIRIWKIGGHGERTLVLKYKNVARRKRMGGNFF